MAKGQAVTPLEKAQAEEHAKGQLREARLADLRAACELLDMVLGAPTVTPAQKAQTVTLWRDAWALYRQVVP